MFISTLIIYYYFYFIFYVIQTVEQHSQYNRNNNLSESNFRNDLFISFSAFHNEKEPF